MMRYKTFILFGAPGSGKGTQGKTLGSIPRFFHCPCGDVFRSIDTRTEVGMAFLEYSSKGQLVPDEITVELWKEAIDAAVDAHKFISWNPIEHESVDVRFEFVGVDRGVDRFFPKLDRDFVGHELAFAGIFEKSFADVR